MGTLVSSTLVSTNSISGVEGEQGASYMSFENVDDGRSSEGHLKGRKVGRE